MSALLATPTAPKIVVPAARPAVARAAHTRRRPLEVIMFDLDALIGLYLAMLDAYSHGKLHGLDPVPVIDTPHQLIELMRLAQKAGNPKFYRDYELAALSVAPPFVEFLSKLQSARNYRVVVVTDDFGSEFNEAILEAFKRIFNDLGYKFHPRLCYIGENGEPSSRAKAYQLLGAVVAVYSCTADAAEGDALGQRSIIYSQGGAPWSAQPEGIYSNISWAQWPKDVIQLLKDILDLP